MGMVGYIDSSFLLSILIEDSRCEQTVELWHTIDTRVSSRLLEIETFINIHKYKTEKRKSAAWLNKILNLSSECLEEINLLSLDYKVTEVVYSNLVLIKCRSLDATHLATAILFQKSHQETIKVFSYDKRMNDVAQVLDFHTIT